MFLFFSYQQQVMKDKMGNPESERRAEFYQQSWCHEAVPRYFYTKVYNCTVILAGICKLSWFRGKV